MEGFFLHSVPHSVLLRIIKWHLLPHELYDSLTQNFLLDPELSTFHSAPKLQILAFFKPLESSSCRIISYFSLAEKGLHSVPWSRGKDTACWSWSLGARPCRVTMTCCLLHIRQEPSQEASSSGPGVSIFPCEDSLHRYHSSLLSWYWGWSSYLPERCVSWICRSQWQKSKPPRHSRRRGRGGAHSGWRATKALGSCWIRNTQREK